MPKSIVILFDGTSNQIEADRTNVLRLYGCLRKTDSQLVWYDPGVGTLAAPNSFLQIWPHFLEIFGLATGWGLDDNVKNAYRFIVENYDKGDGSEEGRDRIHILGFSRGAYSARVLAGFIHALGLMEPRNMNLLDYAYRAYKRIGEAPEAAASDDPSSPFAEMRLYERMLRPDRAPIRALAVFDTVASVFEHGRHGLRLKTQAFTKSNSSVQSVRHAVAIDERRTLFQPQLWPEGKEYRFNRFDAGTAKPQDVKEVWFTGCHGDVGGGYPEAKAGLAKLPLSWLIDEAKALGLEFSTRAVNSLVLGKDGKYTVPDARAAINESMTGGWAILEYLPRRVPREGRPDRKTLWGWYIPLKERRIIPPGARIHQSVIDRAGGGPLPPNVPADHVIEP